MEKNLLEKLSPKTAVELSKGSENGVNIVAGVAGSDNDIQKAANNKEGRFFTYLKTIKNSAFLASILQNDDIKKRNELIDEECDIVIGQISQRTGISFEAIADTLLVEDFSFIDNKGKLQSSFSSSDAEDMNYLFASCITRLSSIIKRQVASIPNSNAIIVIDDIRWVSYKPHKLNERSVGTDKFISFIPLSIRKFL